MAASAVGGKRLKWWAAAGALLIALEGLIVKLEWRQHRVQQQGQQQQ